MKINISLVILYFLLSLSAKAQAPTEIRNEVAALRSIFENGVSSLYRAQLMILPATRAVDPPPSFTEFEAEASVIITVDSSYGELIIDRILKSMLASSWTPISTAGYARAKWCIAAPWGRIFLNVLIDEDRSAVCVRGKWYKVDRNLIDSMLRQFIDVAAKSLETRAQQR